MEQKLNIYVIKENMKRLDKILSQVDKNANDNIFYTNCVCKFQIAEQKVYSVMFNSCFYSESSNCVVFFTKGKLSNDKIEKYLESKDIRFTTITFNEHKEDEDEEFFKEICFVNNKEELEKVICDSVAKGVDVARFYPSEVSSLSFGYIASDYFSSYRELDNIVSTATIILKDKMVCIVGGEKDNLSEEEIWKCLKEGIFVYVNNHRNSIKGR